MKFNKIEASSVRESRSDVEESWWQYDGKGKSNESDSSSRDSQESIRSQSKLSSSKSHSVSFFNSKSESSEGVVFKWNLEASVLQFGDLLDTEVRWSSKKNNNSNHKNWIIVVALFFQVTAK